MSQLAPETLLKTAKLAKLDLSESETTALQKDLEGIFDLFTALNREDIHALEPLGHPLGETQPLRADQAIKRDLIENIETNAPLAEEGFITVPKVIE